LSVHDPLELVFTYHRNAQSWREAATSRQR
jgi:hypothetical protein